MDFTFARVLFIWLFSLPNELILSFCILSYSLSSSTRLDCSSMSESESEKRCKEIEKIEKSKECMDKSTRGNEEREGRTGMKRRKRYKEENE